MNDDNTTLRTHLAENPKTMGALFTLVLLLSQAGNAAASVVTATSGP